ncbi:hypothetical protein [Ralstonia pseudosolanacearum]|uniref:hypothetical protein n=1 Tax=Ralstonia pseudosolanacearum TaxID=1310165 RepID=UPI003CF640CC
MNQTPIVRNTATSKKVTGRRAYVIKKLEQKGKRYADKAEQVNNFFTSCRLYKIADDAFEAARRLKRLSCR